MLIDNAAQIAAASAKRHAEIGRCLRDLSDDELDAQSLLPTWSRLTIACHLRYGAEANYTMTVAALSGKGAAYYPEGRSQQRATTLMPRDTERPNDVVDSLIAASSRLDSLWKTLDAGKWRLEVREPADNIDLGPTTLGMLALLRLTEVEVHGLDLDIDCGPWSKVFVDNAFAMRVRWLEHRRSNDGVADQNTDGKWILRPVDGTPFSISATGSVVKTSKGHDVDGDVEISGTKRDLLAFLLGRIELSMLTVSGDGERAGLFRKAFPPP